MRHSNSTLRLVVQGGLLMALSVSVCMGSPRDKQNKQNNLRDEHITVQRPPASVPPVVEPSTTYTEMLSKGYARIGEVGYFHDEYFNQGKAPSEDQVKKELLEYATSKGAEVAWVSTSKTSFVGAIYNQGGTYSTYNPSSDGYMHNGSVSTTTTTTIGPSFHKHKYAATQGHAVLFVRDPELAARQLEEGKKRWERRVAYIPIMRAPVFAKLDIIQNIISSMDPSLFKNSGTKTDLLKDIQTAREELKSGQWYYVSVNPTENHWVPLTNKFEHANGQIKFLFAHLGYNADRYFKDTEGPQQSELAKLGLDAVNFLNDNWAIIGDYTTPNQPEHILFD